MATLWITEYSSLNMDENGRGIPIANEPALASQAVDFTTAEQSDPFNAATRYVRLIADADCHVLFGADPTADGDDQMLPANIETWRGVKAGHVVSVYDGSS